MVTDKATEATSIKKLIETKDVYAIGALMILHKNKLDGSFEYDDRDSSICFGIGKFYNSKKQLSFKQINFLKRTLSKYANELESMGGITPVNGLSVSGKTSTEETKKSVKINNGVLHIKFSFSKSMIAKVKSLSDRRWNSRNKEWVAPATKPNCQRLKEWGFELPNNAIKKLDKKCKLKQRKMKNDSLLYPYQKEGIEFIESRAGRALIADEMGCISGDASILINRAKGAKRISLRNLYHKFNGKIIRGKGWGTSIPTYTRSMSLDRTEFRLNKIKQVLYKGVKTVYELITDTHKVSATADHIFFTEDNEIELQDLKIGNYIYVSDDIPKLEKIISIKKVGEIDVYDLVMESPNHNFIADGIVVHNCGKTVQALKYLQRHPELRPALIVCPASLKLNWEKEIKNWIDEECTLLKGRKPIVQFNPNILVMNYDILDGWRDYLLDLDIKIIIADELHFCKNPKAKRTKALQCISKKVEQFIGLSGTPIVNKPMEFFTPINLVDSNIFPNWGSYAKRYCNPKTFWVKGRCIKDYSGNSNTDELHDILTSTCFPYDTMVYSDKGYKRIGEIVEQKLKIKVLTVNIKTSKIQWQPIEAYSTRIAPNTMLRIVHEFGELNCTPDHKIWTEKGYIRSEKIVSGISLLVLPKQKESHFEKQVHGCKILFNKMCIDSQRTNRGIKTESHNNPMGSETRQNNKEKMPSMQNNNLSKVTSKAKRFLLGAKKVLFTKMYKNMVWHTPNGTDKNGTQRSNKKNEREHMGNDPTTNIREQKTSTIFKRLQTVKGHENENGYSTKKEMGKTKTSRRNAKILEDIKTSTKVTYNPEMGKRIFRISNNYQKTKWAIQKRRTLFPMGGYSLSKIKTSNRDRWVNPFIRKAKSIRFMENENVILSQVESTEVYESRSGLGYTQSKENNYVYDIQIKENHNFFADNVLVHNCMLRRLKKDVLKDLPPKNRILMPLEINKMIYKKALQQFYAWSKNNDNPAIAMIEIEKMKQAVVKAKMKEVITWINDFLESDEKIVLFAMHQDVIDELQNEFKDISVVIDGRVKQNKRQDIVEQFQTDDKIKIFIGNIIASGVGHTLTASSNVAFIEYPWSPAQLIQAEDRCHRIGQKNPLTIWNFVASDTVEEDIVNILIKKQKVLDSVLDGNTDVDNNSTLNDLLLLLKKSI